MHVYPSFDIRFIRKKSHFVLASSVKWSSPARVTGNNSFFFFSFEYDFLFFDRIIYKNFVPTTYELGKKRQYRSSLCDYTLYMKNIIFLVEIQTIAKIQRIALSELVTSNDQSIS